MTAVPVPAAVRSSVPDGPNPYASAANPTVIPLHLAHQPQEINMSASYTKRTVDHHEWAVPGPAEPAAISEAMQQVENARSGIIGAGPVYLNGRDGAVIIGYTQDAPAEIAP